LETSLLLVKRNPGLEHVSLAYPHGKNEHIGTMAPVIAAKLGYYCALTCEPTLVESSPGPYLLSRVTFEESLAL
jgi:hypothetical protein